jgi:hypothetical protein
MYLRVEKDLGSNGACGSYFHRTKLKLPSQIQKCCGFLYDSVGTPKMRIPDNKVFRALAILDFLMRGSMTVICRLALAVGVGTLQYLVPDTPHTIGASFLHHVYRNNHNETLDNFDDIHDLYHSGFALGDLAQADLSWWKKGFEHRPKRTSPTQRLLHFRSRLGRWERKWKWW